MTQRHGGALTTLTIFTLRPGNRRWGLAQMGTSPRQLRRVAGLRFFQLLGSGAASGFGSWPNFDRYGLLAVWESAAAAEAFFQQHPLWQEYEQRSREMWQAQLAPLKAHGLWDGQQPFDCGAAAELPADAPVAVLTRAAIRWRKVPRFWGFVEPTSAALATVPGVRLAIGLGELPLVRQATFSIWDSVAVMQQYAYRDARHREVIQLTRKEQWYKEELFARFWVIGSSGMIDGKNPVSGVRF
ncbi:spheroidene monooxygenase [Hymenobacter sp. ASUV-10]|uniref:Spheroidene monooxygenase n=1 Tax=Hymenobacter aranciens TaxID=3063996 RepID=A0ABT9B5S6_9BACT|nr:spheroidene monooxygenase [Hymenobacter sp. ASUV-10]MDO7873619.1 spheroidene monooxygenase [Hymenobacter sp. ASUV-10]